MENLTYLSLVHDRDQRVTVRYRVGGVLVKTEVLDERPANFDDLELGGVMYTPFVIMGVDKGVHAVGGALIPAVCDVHLRKVAAK